MRIFENLNFTATLCELLRVFVIYQLLIVKECVLVYRERQALLLILNSNF